MLCPGFREFERVLKKSGTNIVNRILLFFLFIFLITGYLDILEIFICFKDDSKTISISKIVSNTNVYRTCYNYNDEKLSSYNKSTD